MSLLGAFVDMCWHLWSTLVCGGVCLHSRVGKYEQTSTPQVYFDLMIRSSGDDTHVVSFTTVYLELKVRYRRMYLDGCETPYSLV